MGLNFKTPEEAKAFLRKIMGPPRRVLEGQERDETLMLLKLVGPVAESNNQRTMTEVYELNNRVYHITYGLEDEPLVEEIEQDE